MHLQGYNSSFSNLWQGSGELSFGLSMLEASVGSAGSRNPNIFVIWDFWKQPDEFWLQRFEGSQSISKAVFISVKALRQEV